MHEYCQLRACVCAFWVHVSDVDLRCFVRIWFCRKIYGGNLNKDFTNRVWGRGGSFYEGFSLKKI